MRSIRSIASESSERKKRGTSSRLAIGQPDRAGSKDHQVGNKVNFTCPWHIALEAGVRGQRCCCATAPARKCNPTRQPSPQVKRRQYISAHCCIVYYRTLLSMASANISSPPIVKRTMVNSATAKFIAMRNVGGLYQVSTRAKLLLARL